MNGCFSGTFCVACRLRPGRRPSPRCKAPAAAPARASTTGVALPPTPRCAARQLRAQPLDKQLLRCWGLVPAAAAVAAGLRRKQLSILRVVSEILLIRCCQHYDDGGGGG